MLGEVARRREGDVRGPAHLVMLWLVGSFAGQPEACGCRGYARRALSASRRLRDGAQPSCACALRACRTKTGWLVTSCGARGRGVQGILANVDATRGRTLGDTTTFG